MQSGTLLLYLKVHGVIKICSGEIVQHIMVYIFISILLKGSVTDFLVLETKSEMSTHLTSWTTYSLVSFKVGPTSKAIAYQ